MSTKNEALRVVIITLLSVFLLEAFFVVITVHRILFLKDNVLEQYLDPLQRTLSPWEYMTDYNNLLRESTVLLLMFLIINPLNSETKEKQKNQAGKCALAAGTLFGMLAVWILYRSVFISIHRISTDTFKIGWDMMAQFAVLLCGYGVLAVALLKGKQKLLLPGAFVVLLYEAIDCLVFPQDIWESILQDFSYIFGYFCILVFTIVAIVLEKRGNGLNSKLWLIFPVIFLTAVLVLHGPALFIETEFFVWDYDCVVHDIAIFLTMLCTIYPNGLPRRFQRMVEVGKNKEY